MLCSDGRWAPGRPGGVCPLLKPCPCPRPPAPHLHGPLQEGRGLRARVLWRGLCTWKEQRHNNKLYMERTKTQQQTEMTGLSPSRRRYLWRVHSQQQSMKTQLWPLRSGPLLMTRWHQTCNKDRCVKSLIVVHLSRKIYIPYPHLKELLITLYSICIKLVSVNSVALQYL